MALIPEGFEVELTAAPAKLAAQRRKTRGV